MYSAQATNGLGVTDGSGTINPAALNSSGKLPRIYLAIARERDVVFYLLSAVARCAVIRVSLRVETDSRALLGALAHSAASLSPDTSPRGLKRSRSPDTYGDLPADDTYGDDGTYILTRVVRPLLLRAAGAFAGCWEGREKENFANKDTWP